MTQKTIKALYKQPVNYKLTKDGYKTVNGVIQAQDGMPKVVDLSVPSELYTTDLQYNVDVNVNGAPVITTSEFTLPDDQTCEAKKYCYAPKGTNYNYSEKQNVRHYDNFTKIGSPTISQNGILSDITTSNYLRLPNNFNSGNNSWEMLFKIKTSSDITTEQSWIGSSNKTNFTYPLWRLRNEYICLYLSSDGSNWDISSKAQTFQVSANTWYWVKLKFTGSSYESYYSTNGIDYILAYSVSSTSIIYQNQLWNIGCNNWSEGEYLQWLGIIDLSESYIKINGNLWWSPMSRPTEAKWMANKSIYDYSATGLYADTLDFTKSYVDVNDSEYHKYVNPKVCLMPIDGGETITAYSLNATEIGNINFNTDTGVASGFSSVDYLQLPYVIPSSFSTMEIVVKFKAFKIEGDDYPIINQLHAVRDIFIQGRSKKICQWNGSERIEGQTIISEDMYYTLKITSNGVTNNIFVNDNLEFSTTSDIFKNVELCFGGTAAGQQYFPGFIDLNSCYIKINNEILWRGANSTVKEHQYITAKETINGCLHNYNDDGSEHSFDVYYDSNYTQPILVSAGESYSEGTKVDTITLPKHKTWEYSSGGIWNSYAEIDVSNSNYTNTDGNLVLIEYTGNAQDVTLPNPEL